MKNIIVFSKYIWLTKYHIFLVFVTDLKFLHVESTREN